MSDDTQQQPRSEASDSQQQRRRLVMQVDENGRAPQYANAYQVQAGSNEVVLDFGYRSSAGRVQVPSQDGGQEQADRLRFVVASRVALPYPVARQLLDTLQNAVGEAEKRQGDAS